MELTKFPQHRNLNYLNWLRKQSCVVSDCVSECVHHVRLGTNGGVGIKPSDYFCIPLTHHFHTTGPQALHIIGEDSFLKYFDLNPVDLFVNYLKKYLEVEYQTYIQLSDSKSKLFIIEYAIGLIEKNGPSIDEETLLRLTAKKEERLLIKKNQLSATKVSLKGNKFYESQKEKRKKHEKLIRDQNKESLSNYRKEQYQKLKALYSND